MDTDRIVRELDAEIERLRSARALLAGEAYGAAAGFGRIGAGRRRRHMSAAARARISAAQKKRWAKVKAAKGAAQKKK